MISSDKEIAKTHNYLGKTYFSNGNVEMAKLHFEKALQIWPNYSEAKNNLKIITN